MNPLWLALGTVTALPVPAPSRVDRTVAAVAMAFAPLAGLVVAVPALLVVPLGERLGATTLLVAALAVALVALGSRGLHLDGLADTADGLAASYDRTRALAVMRRGDTGPAGAATVALVLVIQSAALAGAIDREHGWTAALLAVVAGRSVLSMACVRAVPAARADGLGDCRGERAGAVAVGVAAVTLAFAAAIVTPLWSRPCSGARSRAYPVCSRTVRSTHWMRWSVTAPPTRQGSVGPRPDWTTWPTWCRRGSMRFSRLSPHLW